MNNIKNKKLGLYIHIPFCISKCYYCDFCSYANQNELIIEAYCKAVIKEIMDFRNSDTDYSVDSIYFGGGTPSSIKAEWIGDIMEAIYKKFNVDEGSENTIEINPGTLNESKAGLYKASGFNRVSVGIQSFDDEMLKKIGRIHNKKEAITTINTLSKLNFRNISIDLMFNLPGQNQSMAYDDVEKALSLGLSHLSYYSLKIEENTPFYLMQQKGELKILPDEIERGIYHGAIEIMKKRGMNQYEISNFSIPGYESRHNLKYWNREEYLGFGVSAHSFIEEKRYANVNEVDRYINNVQKSVKEYALFEKLNDKEKLWEYLILGLRKIEGIKIQDLNEMAKGKTEKIFEIFLSLEKKGLVEMNTENIRLTMLGMDLSNMVFVELMD
ncbi:MAG: radical SAM family heme chaperone HemW [Tissierellales bacterium]|nr:radical SAM family heme chaperone HemW [Tissierellales bacterium]MBN2827020.1 radical SAM family heme chaperone HemW [Tissierellales bacterium]